MVVPFASSKPILHVAVFMALNVADGFYIVFGWKADALTECVHINVTNKQTTI